MSHAMALEAGIGGQGLWSVSRGLARGLTDRGDYKRMMDMADTPRRGDRDERGNLSEAALKTYCEWFLKVTLDQINFSAKLLDRGGLERRYRRLVEDTVDDKRAPDAGRGGAQVSGRPHEPGEQGRVVRPVGLQVEGFDLRTLRCNQRVDAGEQRERVGRGVAHLGRVYGFGHGHGRVPKEPLGLLARRSGAPFVQPVDSLRHGETLWCEVGKPAPRSRRTRHAPPASRWRVSRRNSTRLTYTSRGKQ